MAGRRGRPRYLPRLPLRTPAAFLRDALLFSVRIQFIRLVFGLMIGSDMTLQQLRLDKGLTLAELAELSGLSLGRIA